MAKSLSILVLVLLGAVAFGHGMDARLGDFDELWHLATGKVIVETGTVPARDPFTFTAGETPWVNTNWLAQALLYGAWRRGGFEADWLLGVGLLLGAVGLAHRLALGRVKWALAALPVLAFEWLALASGSTVRPQGWSFVALGGTLLLVEEIRKKATPGRAGALAALLALSFQLHGGFIFSAAALGLSAVGEAIDLMRRQEDASSRRVVFLAASLAAGLLLGAALHPHHFQALAHPFRYALDPRFREMSQEVMELRPPDFTWHAGKLLELPLLVFLVLSLSGRPKLRAADLCVFFPFLHLALTSTRGLHYFAVVAAVPFGLAVDAVLERLAPRLEALEPALRKASRFVPLALLAGWLACTAAFVPRLLPGKPRSLASPLLAGQSDVAEVASFLAATNPPGEIWNGMETGGALIWALAPERRVFIDGRGDLHVRSGAWQEMRAVLAGDEGWEEILRRRHCDTVICDRSSLLAERLRERGWRLALERYTSERALWVLVRP